MDPPLKGHRPLRIPFCLRRGYGVTGDRFAKPSCALVDSETRWSRLESGCRVKCHLLDPFFLPPAGLRYNGGSLSDGFSLLSDSAARWSRLESGLVFGLSTHPIHTGVERHHGAKAPSIITIHPTCPPSPHPKRRAKRGKKRFSRDKSLEQGVSGDRVPRARGSVEPP